FAFTGTSGKRSVVLFVEDSFGNQAKSAAVTVTYDTTPPVAGTITATKDATAGSSGKIKVVLTKKPVDTNLGGWFLVAAEETTVSCDATPVATGSTYPALNTQLALVSGLSAGSGYSLALCAIDKAGNVTKSAVVTATSSGTASP
ncbi:MAG: hypothetical protein RL199_1672, partial [Pseudomonadota bacterium]